jgi:hypothetical protein
MGQDTPKLSSPSLICMTTGSSLYPFQLPCWASVTVLRMVPLNLPPPSSPDLFSVPRSQNPLCPTELLCHSAFRDSLCFRTRVTADTHSVTPAFTFVYFSSPLSGNWSSFKQTSNYWCVLHAGLLVQHPLLYSSRRLDNGLYLSWLPLEISDGSEWMHFSLRSEGRGDGESFISFFFLSSPFENTCTSPEILISD